MGLIITLALISIVLMTFLNHQNSYPPSYLDSTIEAMTLKFSPAPGELELRKVDHHSGYFKTHPLSRNWLYIRLDQALKAGQWQEANLETLYLMKTLSNNFNPLDIWHIENIAAIPLVDLHWIDFLWAKYSQGKFGFLAQRDILTSNPNFDYLAFAQTVEWQVNNHWVSDSSNPGFNYSIEAPKGHLPVIEGIHIYGFRAQLSLKDYKLEAFLGLMDRIGLAHADIEDYLPASETLCFNQSVFETSKASELL